MYLSYYCLRSVDYEKKLPTIHHTATTKFRPKSQTKTKNYDGEARECRRNVKDIALTPSTLARGGPLTCFYSAYDSSLTLVTRGAFLLCHLLLDLPATVVSQIPAWSVRCDLTLAPAADTNNQEDYGAASCEVKAAVAGTSSSKPGKLGEAGRGWTQLSPQRAG